MKKEPFSVQNLIDRHGQELKLNAELANKDKQKRITSPEVLRPGLSLAGYGKRKRQKHVLLFGRIELEYLKDLKPNIRVKRLETLLQRETPAVIIARGLAPPKDLKLLCKRLGIPLLRSQEKTMTLFTKLTFFLSESLSPYETVHGTLVEVFGIGVLLQGYSSIGKSEAALALIERGHRLVSDDVVHVRQKAQHSIEGFGPELTRHLLEIRGIGIINVAHIYGAVSVRQTVKIEIIIDLEEWDENHYYDRVGLENRFKNLLNVQVPAFLLPVKPGREVALLIETTVLNYRLREMGYHSAKEFNVKLLETISNRRKRKKIVHD